MKHRIKLFLWGGLHKLQSWYREAEMHGSYHGMATQSHISLHFVVWHPSSVLPHFKEHSAVLTLLSVCFFSSFTGRMCGWMWLLPSPAFSCSSCSSRDACWRSGVTRSARLSRKSSPTLPGDTCTHPHLAQDQTLSSTLAYENENNIWKLVSVTLCLRAFCFSPISPFQSFTLPPTHVLLELYMKPYESRFSYNHVVILLLAFVCLSGCPFSF